MNEIVQDPNDPNTFVIQLPGDYDDKQIDAFQRGFEAGREFTIEFVQEKK